MGVLMKDETNGKGVWKQLVAGCFLFLLTALNGWVIWILSDVKADIRLNRQEFYQKIDRVVLYYKDESKVLTDSIKQLCSVASIHDKVLEKHETLLHFNHPQRKEFFKEKTSP